MKSFNEKLGQTVSNLLSFEYVIRNFLFVQNSQANSNVPIASELYLLKVQDETIETDFTNYDSLRKLIKKTNKILKSNGLPTIDKEIEEARDCIAHGRLASIGNSSTKIILKFDNAKQRTGKVKLTHRLELTDKWFVQLNRKILQNIKFLDELTNSRTPASFKY